MLSAWIRYLKHVIERAVGIHVWDRKDALLPHRCRDRGIYDDEMLYA